MTAIWAGPVLIEVLEPSRDIFFMAVLYSKEKVDDKKGLYRILMTR